MPVEDARQPKGDCPGAFRGFQAGGTGRTSSTAAFALPGRRCSALTHVTMVAGPDTPSARDVTVLARSARIVTGCRLFVRLSSNQWIGATTLWNGPIPIPALDVLSATGLLLAGI